MSKPLRDRLIDAKGVLDQINTALGRHTGRLAVKVEDLFRNLAEYRNDIDHLISLLDARVMALQFLDGLETQADANDCVPLGASRVKFQHARSIGVISYITLTWALADQITDIAGQIFCTPNAGRNRKEPAKLYTHFLKEDDIKKTTAAVLFESLRITFGWPIGISYALRNHFDHAGGQYRGRNFFEGGTPSSAFRISDEGWELLEKTVDNIYGLERSFRAEGLIWPSTPKDDLRDVLKICEQEMDKALGVLLGSACNSLRIHVGLMLGED